MNLKKILKEEATWYFLALAGLWILLYMGGNIIIDTYFYMISLNILIFLFSYIILRIKKKMHYYSYVVGCAFFCSMVNLLQYMRFEKQKFERLSHQTNHIVVRFLLKEPFPDVYYVDSVGITYK